MKEFIIVILGILLLITTVFIFVTSAENKYEDSCEEKGGVVVDSYYAQNCWKDGGFIKAD